ncbi:MAG: hypothetical protein AAGA09_03600 [Pseudomonadota bacterium]
MSEKRDQGPHYIPELDPERSRFDWNWFTDFYFCIAYLITTGVAAQWFFTSSEVALGLSIIGFGAAIIFMSIWMRKREAGKDTERAAAQTDKRAQSPHYIPELDPASAKHKKGFGDPIFIWSVIAGVTLLIGAVAFWVWGPAGPAKFLTAAGVISFSPLLFIASDGFAAGGA